MADDARGDLGRTLALVVGVAALGGAGVVVAVGADKIVAVVLVLVGASALSGYVKARRPR
jgi:hypothetical protein